MDETAVLAALLDSRKAYDALKGQLASADFSDFGQHVLKACLRYYARDPDAQNVDRSLLSDTLAKAYPSAKQSASLVDYLADIGTSTSVQNAVGAYRDLRRYNIGLRLADNLVKGLTDESTTDLLERYHKLLVEPTTTDFKPRLTYEDLYTENRKGKVRVYPARLNDVLRGGIGPGHNVLVYGRPNAGKTLVTVNMVAGMAYAGKRVLYCANEESAEGIQRRFISRLSKATLWDLQQEDTRVEAANYKRAEAQAMQRGYQNVAVVGSVRSSREIEHLLGVVKPDILVVDQIRHVDEKYDMVQRQETITRKMREWAQDRELLAIGTAQAGKSAENAAILDVTDLDYSNTGVQGACDLMLGIGVTEDMKRERRRMLCICRNKISGTETNFPVWIDEQHTAVKVKR